MRPPKDQTPSSILFARLRGLAAIWWGEHHHEDLQAIKLKPVVENAARYEIARLLRLPGVGIMRIRANRGGYGIDYLDRLYAQGEPEGYEPDEDLFARAEAIGLGIVPGTLEEQRVARAAGVTRAILYDVSEQIAEWLTKNTSLDPSAIEEVRSLRMVRLLDGREPLPAPTSTCEECTKDLAGEDQGYVRAAWIRYRKKLCQSCYEERKRA